MVDHRCATLQCFSFQATVTWRYAWCGDFLDRDSVRDSDCGAEYEYRRIPGGVSASKSEECAMSLGPEDGMELDRRVAGWGMDVIEHRKQCRRMKYDRAAISLLGDAP